MNEPEVIEARFRPKYKKDHNGDTLEVWMGDPLARIVCKSIPQGMGILVNGQWFVKADEFESEYLEKEWRARA